MIGVKEEVGRGNFYLRQRRQKAKEKTGLWRRQTHWLLVFLCGLKKR